MSLQKIRNRWSDRVPQNLAPEERVRFIGHAIRLSIVVMFATTMITLTSYLAVFGPIDGFSLVDFFRFAGAWTLNNLIPSAPFSDDAQTFADSVAATPLDFILPPVASLLAGLGLGALTLISYLEPKSFTRWYEGPKFFAGQQAMVEAKKAIERINAGRPGYLSIHPNLPPLHAGAWEKGALLLGSAGSGKTTILSRWFAEPISSKKHVLVVDVKGDLAWTFQEIHRRLGHRNDRCAVMSPFGRDDWSWALGLDITTPELAQTLCEAFVPEGGDNPMWTTGTRGVLRVVLLSLLYEFQAAKDYAQTHNLPAPDPWSWTHLAARLEASMSQIHGWAVQYDPIVAQMIADYERSQTVASFEITMRAFSQKIALLGRAWQDVPGRPKRRQLSLTSFVKGMDARKTYRGPRTLILRMHPQHEALSQMYVSTVHAFLTNLVAGLPENSGKNPRGLVCFLDEISRLGKLPSLLQAAETNRSKGMLTFYAAQSEAALVDQFTQTGENRLLNNTGLRIYGKVDDQATALELAKSFGQRKVVQMIPGKAAKGALVETSDTHKPDVVDAIPPTLLSSGQYMGPNKKGVRALVKIGQDIFLLTWPYASDNEVPKAPAGKLYDEAPWMHRATTDLSLPDYDPWLSQRHEPALETTETTDGMGSGVSTITNFSFRAEADISNEHAFNATAADDIEHDLSQTQAFGPGASANAPGSLTQSFGPGAPEPHHDDHDVEMVDAPTDSAAFQQALSNAIADQRHNEEVGEINEYASTVGEALVPEELLDHVLPHASLLIKGLEVLESLDALSKKQSIQTVIDPETGKSITVTIDVPQLPLDQAAQTASSSKKQIELGPKR